MNELFLTVITWVVMFVLAVPAAGGLIRIWEGEDRDGKPVQDMWLEITLTVALIVSVVLLALTLA